MEVAATFSTRVNKAAQQDAPVFLFAHGAGAPLDHVFMETAAAGLAAEGIHVLRYNFPYTDAGRRRPDHRNTLLKRVAEAIEWGKGWAGDRPLFAGGKSMGGRMTSMYVAETDTRSLSGIVFYGFPLHPPKKPGTVRAEHLSSVALPLLFLQGTRDRLTPLDALAPIVEKLGDLARLHVIEGADHGFAVLKRSGRTQEDVQQELACEAAAFMLERSTG